MRECFALFQKKNHLTARYVQFYAVSMSKIKILSNNKKVNAP